MITKYVKIDWKALSFAMIFSIIITGISLLILSISEIIQAYPTAIDSISKYIYDNKISTTIVDIGQGPPYYLHL